jgi:hypothetical protein
MTALRFDRHAKLAYIVACVALAVSGLGFRVAAHYLDVYLEKKPVELRDKLPNVARTLGDWRKIGLDAKLDAATLESLGTTEYLDRTYALEGGTPEEAMQVHVAYYTGFIDAVPHVPDRCFEAGGLRKQNLPANYELSIDQSRWREDPDFKHSSGEPYRLVTYRHPVLPKVVTVRMPVGDFSIRVTEFQKVDQPDLRVYAGYFFIANGATAASPEAVKLLAFDPTDEYAYYAKVQFTMTGGPELGVEQFLDHVADLCQSLLPEVMRCLPDWAEVQTRETNAADAQVGES